MTDISQSRRPKGTGSVTARGSRFQASYSYLDHAGRRHRRSSTFDTKTAARQWLNERLAETGARAHSGDLSVAQYLAEWTEGLATQVSAKTVTWYRWAVEKHLTPELGSIRLSELTPQHIDRLFAAKLQAGTGRETLRAILVTIGKALGDADRKGLIDRNPLDGADKPRLPRSDATIVTWDPPTIAQFLEITSTDRMAALWRTAAMTGLRRSEVCGLQWSDIDLDSDRLSVRRAVVVVGGQPTVKEPKTARSRRSVDLDYATVATLHEWRRHQLKERLRAGAAWHGGDWVFTNELGHLVNPEWVGKRFRKLVDQEQLPPITMRQLRHSHATALLTAGVHPKIVQERLGHASIAITLDIYSSVLPTMQRNAVDQLAALIDRSKPIRRAGKGATQTPVTSMEI